MQYILCGIFSTISTFMFKTSLCKTNRIPLYHEIEPVKGAGQRDYDIFIQKCSKVRFYFNNAAAGTVDP